MLVKSSGINTPFCAVTTVLTNKKTIIRTTSLDFWNNNMFQVFSKVKVQLFKLDEQEINKFLKKKR